MVLLDGSISRKTFDSEVDPLDGSWRMRSSYPGKEGCQAEGAAFVMTCRLALTLWTSEELG